MGERLTEKTIQSLDKPLRGNRIVYDDPHVGVKGFGFRVTAGGARSFVLNYRFDDPNSFKRTNEWRYTIGLYPTWSVAAARDEAKRLRQKIDRGECHPLGQRVSARQQAKEAANAETYEQAVKDYIEREQKSRRGNVSAKEVERSLLRLADDWLKRPLISIGDKEIVRLLEEIRDGDAKEDRPGRPGMANHMYTYLRTFFAWAAKKPIGKIPFSPMTDVEKPVKGKNVRTRYFTDPEIYRIWMAAENIGGVGGAFVKVALLLGKRKSALAQMKWEELDETGTWTPPAKLRASGMNKRVHVVPLPNLALKEINYLWSNMNDRAQEGYVFPGRRADSHIRPGTSLQQGIKDAGGPQDFYFHALRHTVETQMAQLKVSEEIRDMILDHVSKRGSGKDYDHYTYWDEIKEGIERWEKKISTILQTQSDSTSLAKDFNPATVKIFNIAHNIMLQKSTSLSEVSDTSIHVDYSNNKNKQNAKFETSSTKSMIYSGRVSPHRAKANSLIDVRVKNEDGSLRCLTAVEMIKIIQDEFKITRNQALAAVTKAVNTLDPQNPDRRSRAKPVGRRLSKEIQTKIQIMASSGMTGGSIARLLGLQSRTVNVNIKRMLKT